MKLCTHKILHASVKVPTSVFKRIGHATIEPLCSSVNVQDDIRILGTLTLEIRLNTKKFSFLRKIKD